MKKWKLCLAAIVVSSALAQTGPATNRATDLLLEKARSLEGRGRMDLAVRAWQQLLVIDPNHEEALAGMVRASRQSGRESEARSYMDRLKAVNPRNAVLTQAESPKAQTHPGQAKLLQAGKLAEAGQYDAAVKLYQEVFGNTPPTGIWAVAYYETLASTAGGWEKATAALEDLSKRQPAASEYRLALGRLYTYRPASRVRGLDLLQTVSGDANMVRQAQTAMRQALIWENGSARSDAALKAYVKRYPDPQVEALISKVPQSRPDAPTGGIEVQRGYQALRINQLENAEKFFREALRVNPKQSAAMAGLGFIRMKQQDFAGAVPQFEAARAITPDNGGVREGLKEARFWLSMQQGGAALKDKQNAEAEKYFRNALNERPDNRQAMEGYAGALMQGNKSALATPIIDKLLKADATNPDLWKMLVRSTQDQSGAAAALEIPKRMPATVAAKLNDDVEYTALLTSLYRETGQEVEARNLFRRTTALVQSRHPQLDSGMRMQLASLYGAYGEPIQAAAIYKYVTDTDPRNLDAWEGFLSSMGRADQAPRALKALESLPPALHTTAQSRPGFLRSVAQLEFAVRDFGRTEELLNKTAEIESRNGGQPSAFTKMQLAQLWGEQGKSDQALQLYSDVAREHPETPDAWKGILSMLARSKRYEEMITLMRSIPIPASSSLEYDPDFLSLAVTAYRESGNPTDALATVRNAAKYYASIGKALPAPLLTQEAWLLLNTPGGERELFLTLREARSRADFTPSQRGEITTIWSSWIMKTAEATRVGGDPTRAIAILEGGMRLFPTDLKIQQQLAAVLMSTGDTKRALAIYKATGLRDASAATYMAAIGTAMTERDNHAVAQWLAAAMRTYPNDPALLNMAGKQAALKGDFKTAESLWRLALQALQVESQARAMEQLRGNLGSLPGPASADAADTLGALLVGEAPAIAQGAVAVAPMQSMQTTQAANLRLPWETAPVSPLAGLSSQQSKPAFGPTASIDALLDRMGIPAPTAVDTITSRDVAPPKPAEPGRSRMAEDGRPQPAGQMPPSAEPGAVPTVAPPTPVRIPVPMPAPATQNPMALQSPMVTPRPVATAPVATAMALPPAVAPVAIPEAAELDRMIQLANADAARRTDLRRELQSEATTMRNAGGPQTPAELLASRVIDARPSPGMAMAGAVSEKDTISEQIDRVENRNSPYLGLGGIFQTRSGQPGFERLTVQESNFETTGILAGKFRVGVLGRPVFLDAGTPDGNSLYRFGLLPVGDTFEQRSVSGIGGELQLATDNFGMRVGSTPRNFPVANILGGIRFRPAGGPIQLSFERDSVRDTLLSYAGTTDPVSGRTWGGVIANAGNLAGNWGDDRAGAYFNMGFQYISGKSVATNRRVDGTVGTYWRMLATPVGSLGAGLNFFAMHYQKNLRFYTLGHGGYFSPQRFILFNVPVTWTGKYKQFEYRAATSLGSQSFTEEESPYFPVDPLVQGKTGPVYPQFSSSGVNYNVDFRGSYQLSEYWQMGAYLNVNNARFYSLQAVGIFVKYSFRPRPVSPEFPVPTVPDWRGRQPFGLP